MDTRALRLSLFVVTSASVLIGALALVLDADDLRAGCFLVLAVVGIGSAPWQLHARIGGYERLTAMFVTAAGILTVAPTLLRTLGLWHPVAAFVGVVAIILPLHLEGLRRLRHEVSSSTSDAWPSAWFPIGVDPGRVRASLLGGAPAAVTATLGAAVCLVAAASHRDPTPEFYGFLPDISKAWYVGFAMLLLALTLGSSGRAPRGAAAEGATAVPVLLLGAVLTLTPALVYGSPRSQSAAKHVDFVEQIRADGALDSSVLVYNAYSGFFDAIAWLSDVTGASELMQVATLWPFLLGAFRLLVLRYLAGQFLATTRQRWIAIALAVLADPLGADYFSPQSLGFVLSMATIGIAVSRNPSLPRLPLVAVGGAALAVSHQLSPYVAGGVLIVLTGFGLVRPWWTPALVLGPALAWCVLNWQAVGGFITLSAIGRLGNFQPPETTASSGLERLPVVGHTVWALVGGILLIGCLALVTLARGRADLVRRPRSPWALAFCPAVGLGLVALQPYGQEGVFRAALFGIPWLALLAAPVLAGERLRSRAALLAVGCLLSGTHLVAAFGLDALNVIRSSDLQAIQKFESQGGAQPAHPWFLLVLNAGDHPTTPEYRDDMHFTWSRDTIEAPPQETTQLDPDAIVADLTDRMVRWTEPADERAGIYALWSPAGALYGEAYAIESREHAEDVRDAFLRSGYWSTVEVSDGTHLFRLDRAAYPLG